MKFLYNFFYFKKYIYLKKIKLKYMKFIQKETRLCLSKFYQLIFDFNNTFLINTMIMCYK